MTDKPTTYIEKFNCIDTYKALKDCLRTAEPSQLKAKCDSKYLKIGECILK